MLEAIINGSNLQKGLFITVFGMLGVFIVLILFYLIIKLFAKVSPQENGNGQKDA